MDHDAKLAPLIRQAVDAMRNDPDPRWHAVADLMSGGPLTYAQMIDGHPDRDRMIRNYQDASRGADVARAYLGRGGKDI
jgi:hypothetical protein